MLVALVMFSGSLFQSVRASGKNECLYREVLVHGIATEFKWLKLMHGQTSGMKPLIGDQMAQNQLWKFSVQDNILQSIVLCQRLFF